MARRAFERGVRQSGQLLARLADTRGPSYLYARTRLSPPRLGAMREALGQFQLEWLAPVARHYLEHRFDLLGSGWVRVHHRMTCAGIEGIRYPASSVKPDRKGRWLREIVNSANLSDAVRIWNLIDGDYEPIDWQLDFKSGFRWSERTWYLDVAYGHRAGVDIKVPWELARMQHLPALALSFGLARAGRTGFAAPDCYRREFQNQVIDFIATNPPRFGVNWACTMEVAIRATNWLIAFDLFRSFGTTFDEPFERRFAQSIHEHGQHIIDNLEWSSRWNGNHYLADICGLLFIAGYLESNAETDAWLAFAVQELVAQVNSQFGEDGGNLEGSTSYHRLAAETVAYTTAFVLGLPASKRAALRRYDHRRHRTNPPLGHAPLPAYESGADGELTSFPPWYVQRLPRMAQFTRHLTKPDGSVVQIGDNDSGRFLKINPTFSAMSVGEAKRRFGNFDGYRDMSDGETHWQEKHLDHRALVEAISALFPRTGVNRNIEPRFLDGALVAALAGGTRLAARRLAVRQKRAMRAADQGLWETARAAIAQLPPERRRQAEIELPGGDLRAGLELIDHPDFGVYLFRSARLWLSVRCGPVGQGGIGGHSHNDQLSVELTIDGRDRWRDPGSYLYTALPWRRNQYRSAAAHFGPRIGSREPARLDAGTFRLGNARRGECLYFACDGFVGCHRGFSVPLYRVILLEANRLTIADFNGALSPIAILPAATTVQAPIAFSPGYGVRLRASE